MKMNEIALHRLANQQISGSNLKTVKEVVGWLGAVQAQDFLMLKWAVDLRLPVTTDKIVKAAIESSEIIPSHVFR